VNKHDWTDADLDALFTQVREPGGDADGAADRVLAAHRARQGHARHVRAGWVSALLASAAVLTGVAVLKPAPVLPSSAAYAAYESAVGDGW
jgi:hypothetical protein